MPNWTKEDLVAHFAKLTDTGRRDFVDKFEAYTPPGIDPQVTGPAKGRIPTPRGMNKNERSYAAHLEGLYLSRQILWYGYEAVRVRIGHDCFLTPDFLVMYPDHRLELHELKGRKGKSFYAEEDAVVKARAVGARFPIPIYIIWQQTDGTWTRKEM